MTTHTFQLEDLESVWLEECGTCCTIRFTDCSGEFKEGVDRIVVKHRDHVLFSGLLTAWEIGSELTLYASTEASLDYWKRKAEDDDWDNDETEWDKLVREEIKS